MFLPFRVIHPKKFLRFQPLLLSLILTCLFIQIWFDVAGVTIRTEDVLSVFLLGHFLLPVVFTLKYDFIPHPLRHSLMAWIVAIAIGILTTLFARSYDFTVQLESIVNGARLIFALAIFFLVLYANISPQELLRIFCAVILIVSFVTSTVAILQIIHWDNWLSITLPSYLITFKEFSNQEAGREIFALYLGNTQAHTWSGVLVFQSLVIYLMALNTRSHLIKNALGLYFLILCFILIRISVRNSILGLGFAITAIIIQRQFYSTRYPFNRYIKGVGFVFTVLLIVTAIVVLAPQNYFVARIWQTLPSWQDGEFLIRGGSNIYGRLRYAENAIQFFQMFPIFGGGFWSFNSLSTAFSTTSAVHAHNSYLQTAAELGLIGVIALCWLLISISRYIVKHRAISLRSADHSFVWYFTVGSTVFMLFSALFSNTFWSPAYVSLWMFSLGMLARYETF